MVRLIPQVTDDAHVLTDDGIKGICLNINKPFHA